MRIHVSCGHVNIDLFTRIIHCIASAIATLSVSAQNKVVDRRLSRSLSMDSPLSPLIRSSSKKGKSRWSLFHVSCDCGIEVVV